MTTATKSKKTAKTETVTKDGVLPRNHFVVVVAIATGCETIEAVSQAMCRSGQSSSSAYPMSSQIVEVLRASGIVAVAKTKPTIRAELSLTDAGWDALAKTRAFYATERF